MTCGRSDDQAARADDSPQHKDGSVPDAVKQASTEQCGKSNQDRAGRERRGQRGFAPAGVDANRIE